jgi:hypothetical protein
VPLASTGEFPSHVVGSGCTLKSLSAQHLSSNVVSYVFNCLLCLRYLKIRSVWYIVPCSL